MGFLKVVKGRKKKKENGVGPGSFAASNPKLSVFVETKGNKPKTVHLVTRVQKNLQGNPQGVVGLKIKSITDANGNKLERLLNRFKLVSEMRQCFIFFA